MEFKLDMAQTLGLSIVVMYIGRILQKKVGILNKYCIPAPVIGGILFSLLTLFGKNTGMFTVTMDQTLRTLFMICFFTTVGFGASMKTLKKGGVEIFIFLLISTIFAIIQNIVGVGLAQSMGLHPLLGLATGSIPLVGGPATSAAFGPSLEEAGAVGAKTVALASATFGLVMGSIIGGPSCRRLIEKYKLKPTAESLKVAHDADEAETPMTSASLATAFYHVAIAVGIGSIVSLMISKTGFVLPAYIGAMFVAIFMRNLIPEKGDFQVKMPEIDTLGDIFLAVFLTQALMGLKLWELADLAIPMMVILIIQTILCILFMIYVVFRIMGKNYDAAILTAGFAGFAMGATPNAIANMNVLVAKYWPSPRAFFVVPIVGGMFIDITNAFIITGFINFLK